MNQTVAERPIVSLSPCVVRKTTVDEIESDPSFPALVREYAEESAIAGLPPPAEKMAMYRMMGKMPWFQSFGAYLDNELVGFIATLAPVIPHYGIAITVAESFFVAKAYRNTGAGQRLLQAAEIHARESGSPGMLISAPVEGQLADVLSRRKSYRETNRVFFRSFADG